MGKTTNLTAADGHRFDAYIAEPKGAPRGGLVVIQEIFGVNGHIRSVCDGYAADGYFCVAPALFDRLETGVDLGYGGDDLARGRELRGRMNWADCMKDVTAAVGGAAQAGKVGTVGYCYGGGVTWLAAALIPGLSASVGYYGGLGRTCRPRAAMPNDAAFWGKGRHDPGQPGRNHESQAPVGHRACL